MRTATTATGGVRPDFQLYTLAAVATTMNSPAVPAVELVQYENDGHVLAGHLLTPEQARRLAAQLVDAAKVAEGPRR